MKRLATLFALLPGAALAHGGHPALTGAAHDSFHIAPAIGLGILVAVALVLTWIRERGS